VKVLIAEDEAISRLRLKARLTGWGYDVVAACDGLEAWDALQAPEPPALAIVDWMMPGIDGTELCRRVRQQAREPYTYILLLTGKGRKEDLIEGLEAGADDYLTKPFDAHELEVRVRGGRRIVTLQRELVASRQAMWFQATHDALTGAWNRAAAFDALRREAARVERGAPPFSVLLVDLDHFKRINDTYGHPVGDAVLKEAVRRFEACLRPYDTLARYGGEEFLVVLPDCGHADARDVAERLRRALATEPVSVDGRRLEVTCSLGAGTSRPDPDVAALIERTDKALYRAKAGGRNRTESAPDGSIAPSPPAGATAGP
jgi:diguanylate cyclase (GGDEF)-like protein